MNKQNLSIKNVALLLSFFIIFLSVTIMSCKKQTSKNENDVGLPLSEYTSNTITITSPYFFDNFIDSMHINQCSYDKYGVIDAEFDFSELRMSSSDYVSNIQNFLGINDNHIVSTSFYLNERMIDVNSLSQSNVLGFSIFYTNDYGRLFHSIFLPNNGNFVKNSNYDLEVNNLYVEIPNFFMHKLSELSTSESVILVVNNDNYSNFLSNKTSEINEFSMKEALEFEAFIPNGGGGSTGSFGCTGLQGCNSTDAHFSCVPYGLLGGYCGLVVPICPFENAKTIMVNSSNYTNNQIDTYFQLPLLHQFEDSLMNYKFGFKYFLYFRAISNVIAENMNLATSIKFANTLIPVYGMINKLLEPNTYGESVMMNSNEHEILIEFLDDIRVLYDNNDYRAIVDDIKNDMDDFEGKTINQILNSIE